jgi:SSS family solute:Na+ symporter
VLKFLPVWTNGAFPDLPFMDRMTLVFCILMLLMIVMSLADRNSKNNPQALTIDVKMFRTLPSFLVGSTIIVGILVALYTVFW